MKNIEGAFGQIGNSTDWVNGRLFKTTKKEEAAIHGFDDCEAMEVVADQRGHKIKDTAITTRGEWVYSI